MAKLWQVLALFVALASGTARALVGGSFGGTPHFALAAAEGTSDLVSALQWDVPDSPHGFSLAGQGFLGRYGLTANEVLAELAPHLAACRLVLARSEGAGTAVHEYYDLYFGAYPLAGAYLHLHHYQNKLAMLRASLPAYRLPATPFKASDFLAPAALGFQTERPARAVLADSGGFPAPAWEIVSFDERTGASTTETVDAQTGAVLDTQTEAFDLASVYPRGPSDGALTTVDLPDLPGTGYLDGKHFIVYAPEAGDPRVMAPDNDFEYLPADPADALNFDQVEAYYGATKALAWFQQKFGFDTGALPVIVHINTLVSGRPDNAQYIPAPVGPKIEIGKGNDVLKNLARDTDVVIHEFGHHVIYQHLKSHSGEAGVLHEGTADYFAYAISGDPHLGTSIVVGGTYLRTAALGSELRYDSADERKGAHYLGQFWSAVLWDLRLSLGDDADKLVYESLSYLGANSGLKDAFLALFNADRDAHPLAEGTAEAGVFGANKCLILKAGVSRGFAQFLGNYDGLACGLDMAALAEESRALSHESGKSGSGKAFGFSAFGRTCAVVGFGDRPDAPTPLVWFVLPVFLAFSFSRVRRRHGS